MTDDYDGLDYSRSNPPPDPALKWNTDAGITAMQQVAEVAQGEIFDAFQELHDAERAKVNGWAWAFDNYIHIRPGQRGAKSFVKWAQKAIPHEVPLFSMTFGQMFEEAISRRGLHPYNSTRNQTFWTGTWMAPVEGARPEQPYEGYGIVTRPHGWSVIYQEDRSKGLSAGMYSGRIGYGRGADKRPGVVVRRVLSHCALHPDSPLRVYPQNMDVLHSPGDARASHLLNEYIHLYGNETYEIAIEHILRLANVVAGFMNDRDFHVLEQLKRDIRRHEHARPVVDPQRGILSGGLQKEIPAGLLAFIGDAAVLSEQLHLGKRAYDLYKVAFSRRWDGEGWRDVAELPETDRPDDINIYHALKLGEYPVSEWEGMPEQE